MAGRSRKENINLRDNDIGSENADSGTSIEIGGGAGEVGTIDPASLLAAEPGEPVNTGRKPRSDRGKPRGPRNKAQVQTYISSLGGVLYLIHSTLSEVTKTPELELSEDEAKNVAQAAEELASQYEIAASEKQRAWFQFISVCAAVYGSRAIAIGRRVSTKKNEKKQSVIQTEEPSIDQGNLWSFPQGAA